jgi:hypothetical protein
MKYVLLIIAFLPITVFAQKTILPLITIDSALSHNANMVVRSSNTDFSINSARKASMVVTNTIAIFNKKGYNDVKFSVVSDKFKSFKLNYMDIYDALGNFVCSTTDEAHSEHPVITSGDVFIDGDLNNIEPAYHKYPFTVSYRYTITMHQVVEYPDWFPVTDYNVSVEKAKLSLSHPDDLFVRINGTIDSVKYSENHIGSSTVKSWEINNFRALNKLPVALPQKQVFPFLELSPTKFKASGFEGDLSTWQSFGLWVNDLNKDLQTLSDETRLLVSKTTHHITEPYEKAKALYELMQKNTRYVSVQIGIGGWQPASAEDTWESGWGDCKALTNLMRALLAEAGINSHYSIIRAGKPDFRVDPEFPANNFNHAILCIPFDNDTTWLECTSQTSPFGYLGSFTSDRNVLVITDSGGVLTRTPAFSADQNSIKLYADVVIDDWNSGMVSMELSAAGDKFGSLKMGFSNLDEQERQEALIDLLQLSGVDFQNISTSVLNENINPVFTISAKFSMNNPVISISNRLIVSPSMFWSQNTAVPKDIPLQKFMISEDFSTENEVSFTFKENVKGLNIPGDINIEYEFGSFSVTYTLTDNILTYKRIYKQMKGIYPEEQLNNYLEFKDEIRKSDATKIALQKTE